MSVTLNKEQCAEQNKRISKLERITDRHTDSISRIETDLQGAWVEIEGIRTRESNNAIAWAVLRSEHEECKPKVETLKDHATGVDFRLNAIEERRKDNKNLFTNVFGNLISAALWAIVGIIATILVGLGSKGLFKP